MESNHKTFAIDKAAERIDEILVGEDTIYEEKDSIPARADLTFDNGFYVNCTCLFIDIRGSSALTAKYRRPSLAKLYRSYISECVALLNSADKCSEVNIHGDSVWGVFDTPLKSDIDDVFSYSAKLNSLIRVLNCRTKKKGYDPITTGIGYERALMIKAGFKGSGLNDVVWMGDVVNSASKLCWKGSRQVYLDRVLMISDTIYNNLNDHNKALMSKHYTYGCYHGDVVNTGFEEWYTANCKD